MLAREQRSRIARSLAILYVIGVLAACGGGPQAAERAGRFTTTAHSALNAVRDSFVAWDAQHQLDLVEEATSLEDGQAALASYRHDRAAVYAAFQASYGALATLATLVPLVEVDKASHAELLVALAEAADAIAKVREATRSLMKAVR